MCEISGVYPNIHGFSANRTRTILELNTQSSPHLMIIKMFMGFVVNRALPTLHEGPCLKLRVQSLLQRRQQFCNFYPLRV